MALPRKQGPAQALSLIGQIPNPPSLPESFLKRFPELEGYNEKMLSYWDRYKDLIQRDRDSITTEFASQTARIDALELRIAALETKTAAL